MISRLDLSQAWTLKNAIEAFASDDDHENQLYFNIGRKNKTGCEYDENYIGVFDPIFSGLLRAILLKKVVAFGRINGFESPRTEIPIEKWNQNACVDLGQAAAIEWEGGCRCVVDIVIVPALQQKASNAGAPAKFAWTEIETCLMIKLGKHGIPENKAGLYKMVKDINSENGGEVLDDSTIRKHFHKNHLRLMSEIEKNHKSG